MDKATRKMLEDLDARAKLSKESQLSKIVKSPPKMLSSKFLEAAALSARTNINISAKTFWGDRMTVVFPEVISGFIYRYGFFEQNLSTIFLNYIKPGSVCFDIGTHFGYFTMLASTLAGESGQVHSFEPTPSTFKILTSNCQDKKNVTLNNVAVWSSETTMKFKDYGTRLSAFNSFYGAKLAHEIVDKLKHTEYEVKTVSLDKYIAETGAKPDFIKIDAESAEYDILQGMIKTITRVRPLITIEVGDIDKGEFIDSKDSIHFLMKHGYSAFEYRDGEIVEHKPTDRYLYNNILFMPD